MLGELDSQVDEYKVIGASAGATFPAQEETDDECAEEQGDSAEADADAEDAASTWSGLSDGDSSSESGTDLDDGATGNLSKVARRKRHDASPLGMVSPVRHAGLPVHNLTCRSTISADLSITALSVWNISATLVPRSSQALDVSYRWWMWLHVGIRSV